MSPPFRPSYYMKSSLPPQNLKVIPRLSFKEERSPWLYYNTVDATSLFIIATEYLPVHLRR